MTTQGEPMTPAAAFQDLARRIMYIHDPDNVCAFLLNYRGFEVPGADLCACWIDEFAKVCAKEKADEFRRAVKKPTSERMLDFLEIWISKYNPNFTAKETERLTDVLKEWTDSSVTNKFKLLLVKEKDRKRGSERSPSRDRVELIPGFNDPIAPSKLEAFKFDLMEQFPPSQIAKQLTLFEWEMFQRIKPEEFLNQAWAKKDKYTAAPNINLLIEQFNKVSYWVAVEILTTQGTKYQTKLLRKFISLAFSCIEHNNYNTALEILAGLNHGAVQRLKGIWEKLPDREDQLYKEMDNLMQPRNNFRLYRKDLLSKGLPSFPQISLICRDFTYIYDGNPRYNSDGSINFDLPMLTYERVKEIEKYQSVDYDFVKNDKILAYFPYLAKFDDYDEDDLHALSLEAQPSMWSGNQLPSAESETNSDTPGDSESSDTASSESGSSRYIKGHGERISPTMSKLGESRQRRGSDTGFTDSEDTSSISEKSSSRKPKTKKPKKAKPLSSEGSESDCTPRSDTGEKELSPRKNRKKKVVHRAKGGAANVCQMVKVPDRFVTTFASSEVLVERFFSQVAQSVPRGTLAIGRKRYLLVRASSLSVDFSDHIRKTFTFSTKVKGDEFFRKLLFNFGQLIAKSDARTLGRVVKLQNPAQVFSTGPIYQSYAGLGFAEILPENLVLPNEINDPANFTFVVNNHVSCEATSWKAAGKTHTHPTCYLLNGYISGWASGSFGVPLLGVEIQCVTKGDPVCRTLLCSPDRAKNLVKEYMSTHDYPDEQAAKVKIPSLLTAQDAELYENARKEMNEKQRKTFKPQKLLNTSKISKEELDEKDSKLNGLEKKSMHYFSSVYSERRYNPREGTVKIGDEGYIFVRGKAISKGFLELILQMFPLQEMSRGQEFAFDLLFDFANSIGKSDYHYGIAKLEAKGRRNLHPLKRMVGLKKAFCNLGWGAIKFDFRTANLVYSPDHFFFRFILDNSFESEIWLKAKQKLKETEEAKKEIAEAAEALSKEKGITVEEALRKLDKANKGTAAVRRRKTSRGNDEEHDIRMSQTTNEVVKSPACVMAAGYANGYLRQCFKNKEARDRDLDLVAVEVACRVTGHPTCEFLVCSKNMVQSSVKTYLKEKNQLSFLPNIKYYNVMRRKDGKKK